MNGQARALLERPAALARPGAPWVAVTGGKGGVGKTLVAVNLAITMAKLGHRVLLVDLDPGLGNVDVHLRLAAPFDVEHVADGVCEATEAVIDGPAKLRVLLGRSGSTRLADGDRAFLGKVLDGVAGAARGVDVVVCDTGAGIGPAVLEVVRRAALALAVTTPDPAAATDTYALCKVLHQRGVPLPHLVVNRAASPEQARRVGERLSHVCESFLRRPLALLGALRADAAFERSVLEQRPAALQPAGAVADELRRFGVNVAQLVRCGAR